MNSINLLSLPDLCLMEIFSSLRTHDLFTLYCDPIKNLRFQYFLELAIRNRSVLTILIGRDPFARDPRSIQFFANQTRHLHPPSQQSLKTADFLQYEVFDKPAVDWLVKMCPRINTLRIAFFDQDCDDYVLESFASVLALLKNLVGQLVTIKFKFGHDFADTAPGEWRLSEFFNLLDSMPKLQNLAFEYRSDFFKDNFFTNIKLANIKFKCLAKLTRFHFSDIAVDEFCLNSLHQELKHNSKLRQLSFGSVYPEDIPKQLRSQVTGLSVYLSSRSISLSNFSSLSYLDLRVWPWDLEPIFSVLSTLPHLVHLSLHCHIPHKFRPVAYQHLTPLHSIKAFSLHLYHQCSPIFRNIQYGQVFPALKWVELETPLDFCSHCREVSGQAVYSNCQAFVYEDSCAVQYARPFAQCPALSKVYSFVKLSQGDVQVRELTTKQLKIDSQCTAMN